MLEKLVNGCEEENNSYSRIARAAYGACETAYDVCRSAIEASRYALHGLAKLVYYASWPFAQIPKLPRLALQYFSGTGKLYVLEDEIKKKLQQANPDIDPSKTINAKDVVVGLTPAEVLYRNTMRQLTKNERSVLWQPLRASFVSYLVFYAGRQVIDSIEIPLEVLKHFPGYENLISRAISCGWAVGEWISAINAVKEYCATRKLALLLYDGIRQYESAPQANQSMLVEQLMTKAAFSDMKSERAQKTSEEAHKKSAQAQEESRRLRAQVDEIKNEFEKIRQELVALKSAQQLPLFERTDEVAKEVSLGEIDAPEYARSADEAYLPQVSEVLLIDQAELERVNAQMKLSGRTSQRVVLVDSLDDIPSLTLDDISRSGVRNAVDEEGDRAEML